jgi:hypothetical protein
VKRATAKGAHAHTFVTHKISRDCAIANIFKGAQSRGPAKDRAVQRTRDGVHYTASTSTRRVGIPRTDIDRDDLRLCGRPEVTWHSHIGEQPDLSHGSETPRQGCNCLFFLTPFW